MHWLKRLGILFTLFLPTTIFAQEKKVSDTSTINRLVDESKRYAADDTTKALALARQAIVLAQKAGYSKGEAYANKNLGMVYYNQSRFVETLNYWNESLRLFEEAKDDIGISNLLNNIGAIYFAQGVDDRALEYCLRALKYAEKTGDTLRIVSALTTIGSIYHNKKNPVALNYLEKALPLCEKIGNMDAYVVLTGNIGEIYSDNNNFNKALEYYGRSIKADPSSSNTAFAYNGIGKVYHKQRRSREALFNHNKALSIATVIDDKLQLIRSYSGLADEYAGTGDIDLAIKNYTKAKEIAEPIKANVELKDLYQKLAAVYRKTSDYQNAFLFQEKYAVVKDILYNTETAKKLNTLQFDFDLWKKEGEIRLLTNEKILKEAEVKAERQAKTAYAVGLVILLALVVIVLRNYRIKVKTNRLLDSQKAEIEDLLLNILPAQVAQELKANGQATPRNYESVSVLFTDFKGFTSIADKMDPQDLVEELDTCFRAFDNIVEKYGLEKIKTIGDAYMCAGGIPTPDKDHVLKIVKASLEMQDYIINMNRRRKAEGKEVWDLRVGIHVGPIVAGVVGKKKYAYDIWGSTVNIASRMESNGAPGKVNISASTYELIKDRFSCSYRGKIHAKNIGEIDMYFIDEEILPAFPTRQGSAAAEFITANA
jgi:adenylate cyclase